MPEFFNFLDSKKGDLRQRYESFRKTFEYLVGLGKTEYFIVETGTARQPGNWSGDGQSTVLFDKFSQDYGGRVVSLELDPGNIAKAKNQVSDRVEFIQGDSVANLKKIKMDYVDLLYLDSYDLDWNNPHPSSLHHLKELVSAMPMCRDHTLVVVDDNMDGKGKGSYVREYMGDVGAETLFDGYQIGFVMGARK